MEQIKSNTLTQKSQTSKTRKPRPRLGKRLLFYLGIFGPGLGSWPTLVNR